MTDFSKTLHNPRLRLAVLILAAGEGSRLGGYPKALLQKEGNSLLSRLCKSLHAHSPASEGARPLGHLPFLQDPYLQGKAGPMWSRVYTPETS